LPLTQLMNDTAASQRDSRSVIPFVLKRLRAERQLNNSPGSLLTAGRNLLSAVRYPHSTQDWLSGLGVFERRHALPPALPETVTKPLSTFAVHQLSLMQRIALLRSHYSLAAKTLPTSVLTTLWTGFNVDLGNVMGKKGKNYHLKLEPARHCGKEGEYSFTFADEGGLELAKLTFTLATLTSVTTERVLLIGGLQGPSSCSGADAKERIITATRDLSGLRPKMAVFVVASAFAAACGATSLRAVSNRTHTINADARYQRRKLQADYDAFWIERGGARTDWGFKIPLDAATPHRACRNEQRAQIATLVNRLLQLEDIRVFSADGVQPLPDAAPT
jgi:uncharacterized protein